MTPDNGFIDFIVTRIETVVSWIFAVLSAVVTFVIVRYKKIIGGIFGLNKRVENIEHNYATNKLIDTHMESVRKEFTEQHEKIMEDVNQIVHPIKEKIEDIGDKLEKHLEKDHEFKLNLSRTLGGVEEQLKRMNARGRKYDEE